MADQTLREKVKYILGDYDGQFEHLECGEDCAHQYRANEALDKIIKISNEQTRASLEQVKVKARGEGEPGNAGEMIAVNYVDEIVNEALKELDNE